MKLFREEAYLAKHEQKLGTIVLHSRPIFWALACGVLILVVAILALLFHGEYTRRATVGGYLIPTAGVVRVVSGTQGRISALHVAEGQEVNAGDRLLTVRDERFRDDGGDARRAVLLLIEERKTNLRHTMRQQRALFAELRNGLQRRVDALRQELAQLDQEKKTHERRLEFARATELRFRELATKNFVSANSAQEKSETVIEQEARLQAIERAQTTQRRELAAVDSELASLPMRERTQLAELERSLVGAEQESIEGEVRRETVVTAPLAGRVSGLSVQAGYATDDERPLLTIVPSGVEESAFLEAHLFAASRDIGFVQPGQEVLIRYSAYPFQKFGHYKGVVVEVSRTPLLPTELPYPLAAKSEPSALIPALAPPATEPMFRIRVALARQTVQAYGNEQMLQPGMQLEADVMLDRRTLIEWMLEPLYSLRGKYF